MRKKLAATVCVFAGVIISASLLIVSVLAATSASATITASVSYTPAIQAKVWLHDGGTYTTTQNSAGTVVEESSKGILIFNNADNGGIHSTASFNNGTISLQNYSAVNGTTFKITVENLSESELIYFGLNISATTDSNITNNGLVAFEDDDPYITWGKTQQQEIGEITYNYDKDQIEKNTSKSISFTPEIVIPVTLSFNIALFTLQPQA